MITKHTSTNKKLKVTDWICISLPLKDIVECMESGQGISEIFTAHALKNTAKILTFVSEYYRLQSLSRR